MTLIILRYLVLCINLQNKCVSKYLCRKSIDEDTQKWDNIYSDACLIITYRFVVTATALVQATKIPHLYQSSVQVPCFYTYTVAHRPVRINFLINFDYIHRLPPDIIPTTCVRGTLTAFSSSYFGWSLHSPIQSQPSTCEWDAISLHLLIKTPRYSPCSLQQHHFPLFIGSFSWADLPKTPHGLISSSSLWGLFEHTPIRPTPIIPLLKLFYQRLPVAPMLQNSTVNS